MPEPPPAPSDRKPTSSTKSRAAYISSGQVLTSPPLTARLTNLVNDSYNFMGLYVASLFSLDPYTAAQNSGFNTRGPGRVGSQARARWGAGVGPVAGAGVSRGAGSGSGAGGGSGGGSGRRLGTVDDVRGPECGSCG